MSFYDKTQEVPYHNSTHAADVTLSMNSLLCTPALEVTSLMLMMMMMTLLTCPVCVHAPGDSLRHIRQRCARCGPPRPHQPVSHKYK